MRVSAIAVHAGLSALLVAGCETSVVGTVPSPDLLPGLWTVSGEPAEIVRLDVQLQGNGQLTPATTVTTTSGDLVALNAVAIAPDGTLWIANPEDSLLLAFAPAALATSGTRTATTVIEPYNRSLQAPIGLAFDAQHRLWVANQEGGTLVRYDAEQLAAGGAPAPAVTLSGAGHPTGLAFDAAGALWVSDNTASTIARYDAAQLVVSGSPLPAVVISRGGDCLVNPVGLAFDAAGTLWIANLGCGTVVGYDVAQLATTGTPRPRVILSARDFAFTQPVGLAFDADGALWVLGATGKLAQYPKASLATSGAPEPSAGFTLADHNLFWSLAFWPKPEK
jgi:sugar lactone lactonase YvrE